MDKDNKINEMNKKILNQENEIKKIINEKINNINRYIIEKEKNMNENNKKEKETLLKEFNKKNDEINIKIKNLQDILNKEIENKIIKYMNENNSQKNNYKDLLKNAINFKCRCPCKFCKSSGQITQWKCPKCSSDEYINEESRIVCPKCGLKEFIWKKKIKCGNHDEDYHEISYQGWLVTLSALGSISNPPTGFLKKITKQALMHEDEFLAE